MPLDTRCRLSIILKDDGPDENVIHGRMAAAGLAIRKSDMQLDGEIGQRLLTYEVSSVRRFAQTDAPDFLCELGRAPGVVKVAWQCPLI